MTRTDSFLVGTLVVLLALVAGLIGVPAIQTASSPSAPPTATGTPVAPTSRPYVEGAMGAAVSISPLTARTQIDRDLVALVFSGLVRNGPGGTIVPDLAESWTADETGKTWTVLVRDDATWHDGEPVTSADVAYTIRTLQDPNYTGPAASSWREVTVATPSPRTVEFTLTTPLGGFLQALTQPIAPVHLLGDVPVDALPEHPFGRQPVGSGPFALTELTDTSATLRPAVGLGAGEEPEVASPDPSAVPTDSLTTPPPTTRPQRPQPYLDGIELRFYTDPDELATDYRAGVLDGASGITPQLAAELGAIEGSRLLRYPGSTLTAVVLNLRGTQRQFADERVRTALLAAIDRPAIIDQTFAMSAATATGPIPPSSPLFDPSADPPVAFDQEAAVEGLEAGGWKRADDGWHLGNGKTPLRLDVLSPTLAANPVLFETAEKVAADWASIGIATQHFALSPGEFVERVTAGDYEVAVVDVSIGLDPDLYPLLASSQTLSGGSNIIGLQSSGLDALLVAARAPGTFEERKAAYKALQVELAKRRYLLPITFADETAVVRDTVQGPVVRQVVDPSDRFWDVLTWRLADDR